MEMKSMALIGSASVLMAAIANPALAASDHSLGKTLHTDQLNIHPVYIQPVTMAPKMPGINGSDADMHLEIDIHAAAGNKHGFSKDDWIPNLTVTYMVQKKGSHWSTFGTMMAMVADDGPHYGHNVKLDGPGKYTASFKIAPPPRTGFLRHSSNKTGVPAWWQPITHSWTFTYVGSGKKGGY